MASTVDKAGRPIVVVTGMGIVTSLGAGKTHFTRAVAEGLGASVRSPDSPPKGSRRVSPAQSILCRPSRYAPWH